MVLDVSEAICGRRSVRRFKKKDIPLSVVESLIKMAQFAPSAGNIQPWEFVVVRNLETKRKLSLAALGQVFVEEAPVVIVVCADENRSFARYGNRGKTLYCIQDTAAATQNILLAAYSAGFGACWVGAFDESEVGKILEIPMGVRPLALIPVGYPADVSVARNKRAFDDVVHYEVF